jgi:tetratricopeptide (TPR) repeat protein
LIILQKKRLRMPSSSSTPLSKKRVVLFKVISILLFPTLLLLLEGGLRLFSYGGSMKLFVDHQVEHYEDYRIVNPFVGLKYFKRFKATEATNDIFLKEKPEDGFRIFLLGSSTTYGFPYDRNLMASRILHKRLEAAYPGQSIEVVNTSITAINSVTLRDYARQVMDQSPDAILIYAGHNEFYGAYGVGSKESMVRSRLLRSMHFACMNSRVYQLIQASFNGLRERSAGFSAEDQKGTLMKRIVKDPDIALGSRNYLLGMEQYEKNLDAILDIANKQGVPVFLSDLVSNVKDVAPFGSMGSGEENASGVYTQAQKALARGDSLAARELFYRARDLDPVRFRASTGLNQLIREAGKDKGAILVPMLKAFEEASKGGIVGNELLTEHVHPNIDGQFLMAEVFFHRIVESGLIASSKVEVADLPDFKRRWGYTELDSLMAVFQVAQLKSYWPYRPLDQELRFRDQYQPEGVLESFAFRIVSEADASGEILHDELGMYYEGLGDDAKALREYEALVHINPSWSAYLNKAANAYFHLSDLRKAEIYLRRSKRFTPSYFSNSMLGEIEFIKHDYKKSLDLFEQAAALKDQEVLGNDALVFLNDRLYFLYSLFGFREKAQEAGAQLLALGQDPQLPAQEYPHSYASYIPYDIEADFLKAVDHANTNADSALRYLERCLEINNAPVVHLHMGDLLYQKQDLRALGHYEQAYAAFHMDPDFLSRLFYGYFVNVNKAGAERTLNRLKSVDPSYHEIPRLETLLSALP